MQSSCKRRRGESAYPQSRLSLEELIAEKFSGIRPAFGYPACPDHLPKRKLFELLDARKVDLSLTESCPMAPAASVSGLYLFHPEVEYFSIGKLGRDQVEDYARRSDRPREEVERWLRSNLDC